MGERSARGTAFIVGPARSGTSLLYKTVCLHPDVAYISNWVARYGLSPLAALDRVPRLFPAQARRFWFGDDANAYRYGRSRALMERAFPAPVEGEPVSLRAGVARPGGPTPASRDPVVALRDAFDSIRTIAGGSCVVSKRIANNLRIPLLVEVFPEARFVALIRDGRAVAASLSKVDWWDDNYVWWFGGTPRQWRAEGGDPWEICARNWVEELAAIEDGLRLVPMDHVLRLRYEDLVVDPVATLLGVADFIGVSRDQRWRTALGKLEFPDRSDRWREGLDASTVERINAIQETQLVQHGYQP